MNTFHEDLNPPAPPDKGGLELSKNLGTRSAKEVFQNIVISPYLLQDGIT